MVRFCGCRESWASGTLLSIMVSEAGERPAGLAPLGRHTLTIQNERRRGGAEVDVTETKLLVDWLCELAEHGDRRKA